MAGMHGAELHVKVSDDVRVSFAWFECFSGLYSITNDIDHAVVKINTLVEDNDFRMFVVIEKSR